MKTRDNIPRLSSLRVAELLGLSVIKRGSRFWTLCPFHSERTASFLFNEDGSWHCFGCDKHGNAVHLYAGVKRISTLQASRELAAHVSRGLYLRTPEVRSDALQKALLLKNAVSKWVDDKYQKADQQYRSARLILDMVNDEWKWARYHGIDYESGPAFDYWVNIESRARLRMDKLYTSDQLELMKMMLEEQDNEQHTTI